MVAQYLSLLQVHHQLYTHQGWHRTTRAASENYTRLETASHWARAAQFIGVCAGEQSTWKMLKEGTLWEEMEIHSTNGIEHYPHVNQRNQWVAWRGSWTRAKGKRGVMWHYSLGYINKLLLTPNREVITYLSNNSNKIQLGEPMRVCKSWNWAGIAQPRQEKEAKSSNVCSFPQGKNQRRKGMNVGVGTWTEEKFWDPFNQIPARLWEGAPWVWCCYWDEYVSIRLLQKNKPIKWMHIKTELYSISLHNKG